MRRWSSRPRTGVRAFTLHYAAPEQVRGEPVTTMTDVYALGVVLYELLTDTKPYRLKRQTDAEWEEAILAADPLNAPRRRCCAAPSDSGADVPRACAGSARELAGDLDNIVLKTLVQAPRTALSLGRGAGARPDAATRPAARCRRGRRASATGFGKYLRRHRWSLATGGADRGRAAARRWPSSPGRARQAVAEAGRAQAMQDFMVGVFESRARHAGRPGARPARPARRLARARQPRTGTAAAGARRTARRDRAPAHGPGRLPRGAGAAEPAGRRARQHQRHAR